MLLAFIFAWEHSPTTGVVCVMTYDYMTFTRSDIKTNICSLNILNIDLRGEHSGAKLDAVLPDNIQ